MTLLWNVPREWEDKDPITADRLNDISDSLNYLFTPSKGIATVRGNGTNQTTALTTPTQIDNASYLLNVELTGLRDVYVELVGAISNATLAALNKIDVGIDGTNYVSSLTGTPVTNPLHVSSQYVAAAIIPVSFRVQIPAGQLAAGFHTFYPMYWVSAGTVTWYMNGVFSQFRVGEL